MPDRDELEEDEAFQGIDTSSFLSTEDEWHYFAGGGALGFVIGFIGGVLVVKALCDGKGKK